MKKKKTKKDLAALVGVNQIGWSAIRHKDGWWVGTEKGVTCYNDRMLARMALTLIWQRDGGEELNFSIEKYTKVANKNVAPDFTPNFSAEEALNGYTCIKSA
jgi:hypothetical protein